MTPYGVGGSAIEVGAVTRLGFAAADIDLKMRMEWAQILKGCNDARRRPSVGAKDRLTLDGVRP